MEHLLERITMNTNILKGKPSIRNMRFSVSQLLELLAAGMSNDEILKDYPYLEIEDIYACLYFAAKISDVKNFIPAA